MDFKFGEKSDFLKEILLFSSSPSLLFSDEGR